jgi:hypothetical protein
MSAVCWPEAVAAGISLLEVAFGPEIAEEAFAAVMGIGTFEAACRKADAKARGRNDPKVKRLLGLLDEGVSLPAALAAMQKGCPIPEATVEAIRQAVREGGAGALDDQSIKLKLQSCDHSALADLDRWLLRQGSAT